jgi:steroid 5-alpha reductase family enzyme
VVQAQGPGLTTAAFNFELWLSALRVLLIAATLTWLLSLPLRNVSIAGPLWSLLLFAAGVVYGLSADPRAPRLEFVLWLVAVWAARQSIYLIARTRGQAEDARYEAIRWKSLYRVFWLQAAAAWIVSLPLLGVFASNAPIDVLDYVGMLLWLAGFVFEAGGDRQLLRFGRHPNYWGSLCVWWGFWCMAASAGAWWSAVGPVLLTVLLVLPGRAAIVGRNMPTTS